MHVLEYLCTFDLSCFLHFVAGTHTENFTKRKAARAPRSSTESETSSKRMATRASRTQSGPGRESTKRKAPRDPKIQSGLSTESEPSTEDETTSAPLIQSGECALARL